MSRRRMQIREGQAVGERQVLPQPFFVQRRPAMNRGRAATTADDATHRDDHDVHQEVLAIAVVSRVGQRLEKAPTEPTSMSLATVCFLIPSTGEMAPSDRSEYQPTIKCARPPKLPIYCAGRGVSDAQSIRGWPSEPMTVSLSAVTSYRLFAVPVGRQPLAEQSAKIRGALPAVGS